MIFGKHWPGRRNKFEIYQAAAPSGPWRRYIANPFIPVHPGLCPDGSSPDAQFFNGVCLFNRGGSRKCIRIYSDYQDDEEIGFRPISSRYSSIPSGPTRMPQLVSGPLTVHFPDSPVSEITWIPTVSKTSRG